MTHFPEKLSEPLQRAGAALAGCIPYIADFIRAILDFAAAALPLQAAAKEMQAALNEAPPRVRYLAKHGKKHRTRKKNLNRALREYKRRT